MKLTAERLKEAVFFDSETGMFFWKNATYRARHLDGKKAGSLKTNGYRAIQIDGVLYLEHRLAWLYVTGQWPLNQIDHIDGNKSNNKIINLRQATVSENKRNRRLPKSSKTGLKGVSLCKHNNMFYASIGFNGKNYNLGYFDCPAAASFAYQIAADKFHREFARGI